MVNVLKFEHFTLFHTFFGPKNLNTLSRTFFWTEFFFIYLLLKILSKMANSVDSD